MHIWEKKERNKILAAYVPGISKMLKDFLDCSTFMLHILCESVSHLLCILCEVIDKTKTSSVWRKAILLPFPKFRSLRVVSWFILFCFNILAFPQCIFRKKKLKKVRYYLHTYVQLSTHLSKLKMLKVVLLLFYIVRKFQPTIKKPKTPSASSYPYDTSFFFWNGKV